MRKTVITGQLNCRHVYGIRTASVAKRCHSLPLAMGLAPWNPTMALPFEPTGKALPFRPFRQGSFSPWDPDQMIFGHLDCRPEVRHLWTPEEST